MDSSKYCVPKTAYIHDDFDTSMPAKQSMCPAFKTRIRNQVPSHLLFDIEKTRISENLIPTKVRKPDFRSRTASPIPFTAPPVRSCVSKKLLLGPLHGINTKRPSTDSKLIKARPTHKLDVVDFGLDVTGDAHLPASHRNHDKDSVWSVSSGSFVPSTFKKLPHLVSKIGDDQKVAMVLSSLQDHEYISKSPSHSKALTLSRRGYVEFHKEGLTELTDVATLEMYMQKFALVSKHTIIQKFREFKCFRKWDRALRKRKFDDRRKVVEASLIQTSFRYWGCVQQVMAECVQLETDVQQPPWEVPAFGLTLDTLSHELQRRCDILVDALEATRSRIAQYLSQFFDSISSEIKVSRLKKIYQLNRMHNSQAASTLASKDVQMICRVYCLCEHILCETAINLHNSELRSLGLLLMNGTGVLQIEAFMQLNRAHQIPRTLPFSPSEVSIAADAAAIVLIPNGHHVLETLQRDMNAIFNSIASWMQPRIVENLSSFLPPDLLTISFKPDYRHCLPNSYDYISSHSILRNSILQADTESLVHCQQCLDHIKPIFAYVESFSSELCSEQLNYYPQNAEQYILWREIVVKLPGQESHVKCFRVKYRRFKSHLQERLQREVIDQSFKQYYEYAGKKLADLKVMGAKYLRHLEEEISTYQQLIVSLPFIYELEQKVDLYIEDIQTATRMRETLQKHYLDTTSGVDGTSKFILPVLNQHLADQMRAHYSAAISRIREHHSQHIDIVQAVHSDFLQCFKLFEAQLRGPLLRNISSNVVDVKKLMSALKLEFKELQLKADEISKIMDLMKLNLMDVDQLASAQSVLTMMDEIWNEIEVWKSFFGRIMDIPISDLQAINSETEFFEISNRIKTVILKYEGADLVAGLKGQYSDFERQWPILQKLMDPKMKRSHFQLLISPSKILNDQTSSITRESQIELSKITISSLVERGVLNDSSRLFNVYALAAKEEAMFGLSERLQQSVECLSVLVRSEDGIMWLDDFDVALTKVQDHSDALDWLQASGFADMVMKELLHIGTRNIEIKELLTKLQRCSMLWSRNRSLLKKQFPLDMQMKDLFLLETANTKWIRCMKVFDVATNCKKNGRGDLILSKLEPSSVQKIQDALDSWEKTTALWEGAVQQMRNEFPRLYLLNDDGAINLFSYFASSGPDISAYTLSTCFSNTHDLKFNEFRLPICAVGAYGECLHLPYDAETERYLEKHSKLSVVQRQLKDAVRLQIFDSASEVTVSTTPGNAYLPNVPCRLNASSITQAFLIAFQVRWSEQYVGGNPEAHHNLLQDIEFTLKLAWQRVGEAVNMTDGNSPTKFDTKLILERARLQALILVCQQWKAFVCESAVDATIAATPFYQKSNSDLVVRFGPCSFQYGYEFLGIGEPVTLTPQTKRYSMYIMSCFCSQGFGFIIGPDGCGKTHGLKQVSIACGWMLTVFDISAKMMRQDLHNVVKGCILGESWLCIRNSGTLVETSMCQLAQSISKAYDMLKEMKRIKEASSRTLEDFPPPVFLVNSECFSFISLPYHLREITRPFHHEEVDKRVLVEVFLRSHGSLDSGISLKIQSIISVLSVILPSYEERLCLNSSVLKALLQQIGTISSSSILESKGEQRSLKFAYLLLSQLKRQLCHRLYVACEMIVKHFLGHVDQQIQDSENAIKRVNSAIVSMCLKPSEKFVACCFQMFQTLNLDRRPTIVVGPPQSGKSSSIKIVRLAQIIDLTGSAKDFVPNTLIAFMNKNGFHPAVNDSEFWSHIESQADRNLSCAELIFKDQWIVVDSARLGSSDLLLQYILQRHKNEDLFGNLEILRPRIFLETCSIADAHPCMVCSSNVLYVEPSCIGWKDVFESWCCTVTSKMEERDLGELCQLVENHIHDVLIFIECNCSKVVNTTEIGLAKTFCSILEHYFFLGRKTALRRTTKFCKSAFIFSTTWSFGALIKPENREMYSKWFKARMDSANICIFDGEQRASNLSMWDYIVGEENMGLQPITDKEFDVDTRIQRQLLYAPTKEMCMYEYLFSIYKLQRKNVLYFGGSNVGKSIFLTLMEKKTKNDSKISDLKMICNRETHPNDLSKWLLRTADQIVMTNSKLDCVNLFIDDLHLPVDADNICEMLRYICEHKGLVEVEKCSNDKLLSRINIAATCDISKTVSSTNRWLGHFALVPASAYCLESLTSISYATSELGGIITSNSVKSVFGRLPAVLTELYKWISDTVPRTRGEDLFLRWSSIHLHNSVKALSYVSWKDMDGPNLCLSYVWHDLMRIYSDRMTDLQQIASFRSSLKARLIEALGRNHARTVNFASERQAFYILLPIKSAMSQSGTVHGPWDFHEISHDDLVQKAVDSMHGWDLSRRKVVYIPGFARHISHALHTLRPSNALHSSILVGPRGSGKKSVIKTASAMCNFKVISCNRSTGVRDIQGCLKEDVPSVLLFYGPWLHLDSQAYQYIHKLLKGQNLEGFERNGLSNLRLVFCVDINCSVVENSLAGVIPENFNEIIECSTVDWYEGWTDLAISELIEREWRCAAPAKGSETSKNFADAIFGLYMDVESAAQDFLCNTISANFPLPAALVDFMSSFSAVRERTSQEIQNRLETLKEAVKTFDCIREYEKELLHKEESLEPLVSHVTEVRVKCREDASRFERIAKRAQEIAESEMIGGLQDVLYGDAPGQDLQQEFQDSKIQLSSAAALIHDLKPAHLTQLEISKEHPELQELLFGSLSVCLGLSELDAADLKESATGIPVRLKNIDLNRVSRERIYELRPFVADSRFIPEKLFGINRAAGALCHWVRCFERFARANEWMKPDSISNEKQSLERVRGLAKIRLSALEEVQASVQHSKQKRVHAVQDEITTKDQLSSVRSQLKHCRTILEALTGLCASWKVEIHELEKRFLTLEGDCLLFAATTTFLGLFSFEKRHQIVIKMQKTLNYPHVGMTGKVVPKVQALSSKSVPVSEDFGLSLFCNADFWLKQWEKSELSQDKCSRENIVLALSTGKIPYFIDPHKQAARWLLASFPNLIHVSSVDIHSGRCTKEKLITILETAQQNELYVLLEDADEVLSDLLLLFQERTFLLPNNQDPFPGSNYRIFLANCEPNLQSLVTCDASCLFTMIDMRPDAAALESMARTSILSSFDSVSLAKQKHFIEGSCLLRKRMRETETSLVSTLQSKMDPITSLREGDTALVSLCDDFLCARTSFQNLIMESMGNMRSMESYDCLVLLVARVLACVKGPCNDLLSHDYSECILNIIKSSSGDFDLNAEECWSLKFKKDLERLSSIIVAASSYYLTSVSPEQRGILNILIWSCRNEDDFHLAQHALTNIVGVLYDLYGANPNGLLSRSHGPGQRFCVSGWKWFATSCVTFGIDINTIVDSLNSILAHESSLNQVDSRMIQKAISLLHLGPLQKFVLTCCLNPQYVHSAIEQVSSEYFVDYGLLKINCIFKSRSISIFLPQKDSLPKNQVVRNLMKDPANDLNSIASNVFLERCKEDELESLVATWDLPVSCSLCVSQYSSLMKVLATFRRREKISDGQSKSSSLRVIYAGLQGAKCNLNLDRFNIGFPQFCTSAEHPKDVFECVIADLWGRNIRSADKSISFWRAVLGICYFYACMYHYQRLGLPAEMIEIPVLKLQQVMQSIQLLELNSIGLVSSPVDTTQSIVSNAFLELFRSVGHFANFVLKSIVNEALFNCQGKRLKLFKVEVDFPDKYALKWRTLIEFASSLPIIQISSYDQIPTKWSLQNEDLMKMCESLRALNQSAVKVPVQINITLVKTWLEKLPTVTQLEQIAVTGYFQPFKGKCNLKDTHLLILENLMTETLLAEKTYFSNQVSLIRCDLNQINAALSGKSIYSKDTGDYITCLEQQLVPARWNASMYVCKSLSQFWECIQEKAIFFGNIFQDSDKRSRVTSNSWSPLSFPLHLFQNPKKILDIFLVAYNFLFSDSSINDICFCTLPVTSDLPTPESGLLVSGIQIFGAQFCPSTGCIYDAYPDYAELTRPLNIWLRPVCRGCLPFRATMKAEQLYWIEVSFYPNVPTDKASFAIEKISTVFLKSKFNPLKLPVQHSIGVFLGI